MLRASYRVANLHDKLRPTFWEGHEMFANSFLVTTFIGMFNGIQYQDLLTARRNAD